MKIENVPDTSVVPFVKQGLKLPKNTGNAGGLGQCDRLAQQRFVQTLVPRVKLGEDLEFGGAESRQAARASQQPGELLRERRERPAVSLPRRVEVDARPGVDAAVRPLDRLAGRRDSVAWMGPVGVAGGGRRMRIPFPAHSVARLPGTCPRGDTAGLPGRGARNGSNLTITFSPRQRGSTA